MSLEERVAEIRSWTNPPRPVSLKKVAEYAALAASWEEYRLRVHRDSLPADAERFLALTTALRPLVAELGLPLICTADDPGEGVPGVTDRSGYLSMDPARILGAPWPYATALALYRVCPRDPGLAPERERRK
ncbi:MAG: hypothetical protein WBW75_08450 [Mycobacterium sp.]|uniref:hypothetical protein n=1 Tax=Mycobacterium sp. TaxID=1785 RepID=UPI003C3BA599